MIHFCTRKTRIRVLAIVLFALGVSAFFWTYSAIGKTPGELMDYTEKRLQGHPNLELVALPSIGYLRILLNQPSSREMLQRPFVVPRPPALALAERAKELAPPSSAQEAGRRILRVGPFEEFRSIAQAAQSAKDYDIVEIQAGEYHGDVAVWNQRKLVIRTRGGNARIFADGKSAEGKAIWVIRNGDFDIENIDFIGTHVDDHNGAGIRFEGGRLHIKNCLFFGNDDGLLTTESANLLDIENSEFAYNGFGDGLSHNIYVNKIHTLKITGSYFHHANTGHLIKSRAHNNYIYYNRITDESGGRASYEIDLPNGGIAYIVGNIIQQGSETQNSTLIEFGGEGLVWPENRLYLASNTIVNDHPYGGTVLLTAPGTQRLLSINNLIVGKGTYHRGTVQDESINNIYAGWKIFERASRHDYRLNTEGRLTGFVSPELPALIPTSQYQSDRKTIPLNGMLRYPGAFQLN